MLLIPTKVSLRQKLKNILSVMIEIEEEDKDKNVWNASAVILDIDSGVSKGNYAS